MFEDCVRSLFGRGQTWGAASAVPINQTTADMVNARSNDNPRLFEVFPVISPPASLQAMRSNLIVRNTTNPIASRSY